MIDNNIQAPVKKRRPRVSYPFAEMEVGDEFTRDIHWTEKEALANRIRAAANAWRRYHNPEIQFYVTTTWAGVLCRRTA
jgi:hypothetical protein